MDVSTTIVQSPKRITIKFCIVKYKIKIDKIPVFSGNKERCQKVAGVFSLALLGRKKAEKRRKVLSYWYNTQVSLERC